MEDQALSRRTVLGGVAGAAVLTAAVQSADATDAAGNMMVEWNQHMFSNDVAKYPLNPGYTSYSPPDRPGRPHVDPVQRALQTASHYPADPVASYLASLKARNIDRALLVQPEPYADDYRLLFDCLHRVPADRFKCTSLFYPRDPNAPAKLRAMVKQEPRVVSTRFHKLEGNDHYMESFADPGVRALWKQGVDLGLVIELHIGPQFGRQVADIIKAFPGSRVLIDHLAEPPTGNPIDYGSILDLAQLPDVYIKLSELGSMAKDPPYYESLLPLTRRIVKEFGPDRFVWSGEDPKIAEVHMQGYSQADIAKARGGNLRRLLNWA